jgi:hypothetical protein
VQLWVGEVVKQTLSGLSSTPENSNVPSLSNPPREETIQSARVVESRMPGIELFLSSFTSWAAPRSDIVAVALVGSWARGTARPDSDVDLVMIVRDRGVYENDDAWLWQFGTPRAIEREDWGRVQSRRVFYEAGPEVEFGLTTADWMATDPLDDGTAEVIANGARVVLDQTGRLGALIASVRRACA